MTQELKPPLPEMGEFEPDHMIYKGIKIAFDFRGIGIGDTVCAEPIVRFALDCYYPNLKILTDFPGIFSYYKNILLESDQAQDYKLVPANPYKPVNGNWVVHPFTQYLLAGPVHSIDFLSLFMLRQSLPEEYKQIKLIPDQDIVTKLLKEYPQLPESWLIHPGFGAPLKSFGADYWNEVVEPFDNFLVVGKDMKLQGYDYGSYALDKGISVQNKWDLSELIAACSVVRGVVTNDSAVLHIMGSFYGWIVVIPTIKHPDFILPYREGDKYYRVASMKGVKYYSEEYDFAPHQPGPQFIGEVVVPFDPSIHLPKASEVSKIIIELNNVTDRRD